MIQFKFYLKRLNLLSLQILSNFAFGNLTKMQKYVDKVKVAAGCNSPVYAVNYLQSVNC